MMLQHIKTIDGNEYILLPVNVYRALKKEIEKQVHQSRSDYIPFSVHDYVDNPVALARIQARASQQQLADLMKVSQPYIAKLEGQKTVSVKTLDKVHRALKKFLSKKA